LKIDLFDFVEECHLVWEEIKAKIREAETPIFSRHFPIEFVSNLIEQYGEFQVLSGQKKKHRSQILFQILGFLTLSKLMNAVSICNLREMDC
jgi:hypothetical protein